MRGTFAAMLLGGAAMLLPMAVRAESADRPVGIYVLCGYQRYEMSDVNKALGNLNVIPGGTGSAGNIEGGVGLGGGLRIRAASRIFVSFDATWMDAGSNGTVTIDGLPYSVAVELPVLELASTVGAWAPAGHAIRIGLGVGGGYYFTTGVLRLNRSIVDARADMDAEAFGLHGLGFGELRLGSYVGLTLSAGYRHAKARSLRVAGLETREPDGSAIAPDWSGPMAQLTLVYDLLPPGSSK